MEVSGCTVYQEWECICLRFILYILLYDIFYTIAHITKKHIKSSIAVVHSTKK